MSFPFLAVTTGTIVAVTWGSLLFRAWRGTREWPLLALSTAALAVIARAAVVPGSWTPEAYVMLECFAALCAATLALQVRRLSWGSALGLLAIGAVGWVACTLLPVGERCGYRGLAVVDLGAAWLLACAWRRPLVNGLRAMAVLRLGSYLALQAVYACSWEYSVTVALFVGWLSAAAWCWLCFGLAVESFRHEA